MAVEARVEAGLPVSMSMNYFLRPDGASAVPFTSLRFGESRAANVRAFLDGRELSFRVGGSSPSKVEGRVELPEGAAARGRLQLHLLYEVLPEPALSAELFTLTVPLLVVEWPPAETQPETFTASVHLPPGVAAHAAFPSEFTRIESVDRASGGSAYRFALPVVPALIRLDAGTGEPPILTAERAADIAAAGLLLVLAAVGWRRLRQALES